MDSTKQEQRRDARDIAAQGERDARELTPTGTVRARRSRAALEQALRTLRHKRERLSEAQDGGSAEWLLDNWYLAEREGRAAMGEFAHGAQLRAAGGTTVLAACCGGMVRALEGGLSASGIEAYLTGFQRVLPLRRAELALLIPGLKAAVVRTLAETYRAGDDDGRAAGQLFSSLRLLGTLDFSALLERVDPIEQRLRRDPAGVYGRMDERTRAYYRRAVERQARRAHTDEIAFTDAVLERANAASDDARHVGWQLLRAPGTKQPGEGGWYIAAVLLLTLFFSLLFGFALHSVSCAVLLLLPVSELVKNLLDTALLRHVPPRFVPRMELAGGVPRAGRTICVISALLTKPEDAAEFARKLEEFRLCNRDAGDNLRFGLLADLPEGNARTLDADRAALDAAAEAIDALNTRCGGGFYLFARERTHSERDGVWRGRERKRGALLALARLLLDRKSELRCLSGDLAALKDTRYLLTLDSDTFLCPGTARELIGAMLHPLNRPVVDPARGAVTSGYGLLHPRMAVELESATASDFARVFAGQGGTDPYGTHCGELYMDLFDCGGFAGKGILDAEALLLCCDRAVPENRVLSHDALEGAYLHGGYLGDVELTDRFPSSPLGYYARMERWTRGDWQNLPWLLRRGRHFRPIDRWKLFDSLRRSLVPPMTFLAIAMGLLLRWPGLRLAAWAALLSLLSRFLLALGESMMRPESERRVRYHSTILHGAALALVQTALRLMLLPYEAWICASAIVRALWRMAVSHRRMLDWQTAAQSERARRGTLIGYFLSMWEASLLGLLVLLLAPQIAGKAVGLLWLLSPALTRTLSHHADAAQTLSARDRAFLLGCARDIWRYFSVFCTEEDHALPPDNWQEQPPAGAAHRTSPTNIGLALVSALCARELQIDEGEAIPLLERMLDTMERLPKWRGHFYNWYHTCTLRPLKPAYVSTVDSGNLAACLLAVRGAMEQYGRHDLARRADALFQAMDFSPLYDETRRLFRIGIDTRTGEPSPGWYDLLSSEARLTGYVAIAKGDVDRRHWRRLSRAQVQKDGYRGMASWTGTMFEYLMPELFLPLAKESLLWESAKFCLYVQRRRVPPGTPWGVSESGYFSLDSALHYRYKAHGCAALALRRGMDRELVVSPYSSFLALCVEPRAAVRNLRRLEALGLRGPYGFREAIDFTPARCRGTGGEVVQSVMAHHLGMSLAAICNCLRGGQVRAWCMADPAMHAHLGLLQERVPIGGVLLRRRGSEGAVKPRRTKPVGYVRAGEGTDAACPSRWEDWSVFGDGAPALRLQRGGETLPLFPLTGAAQARWRFTEREAWVACVQGGVSARLTAAVSANDMGELRTLELTAPEGLSDAVLQLVFSPVLAKGADAHSHPAFWRLGLQQKSRGGALLLRRLSRGGGPELWLSLACDRALEGADSAPRWLSDGRVVRACPIRLAPGETVTVRFAFGVGRSEEAAFQAAQQTLAMPRGAFSDLPARFAAQSGMDGAELAAAMALVGPLSFPTLRADGADPALLQKQALWRFGVSGDLPILCAPLTKAEHRAAAVALLRRHALLQSCGLEAELVFCTDGTGDYQQSGARLIADTLRALDREGTFGAPGGVHLAEGGDAIYANAAVIIDPERETPPRRSTLPAAAPGPDRRDLARGAVDCRWLSDGSFVFRAEGVLPRRAWSHVLTNGRFGFTAADSGCGDLWYRNAREGRVTPWHNDPYAVRGAETLDRLDRGEALSFFADGADDARVTYRFGCAVWETERAGVTTRLTAFVPPDVDARVFLLECSAEHAPVRWTLDLLLAADSADAPAVITRAEDGVLSAENPRAAEAFRVSAVCSEPITGFTCDRSAAARGQLDGYTGAGRAACFCMEFSLRGSAVLVCGSAPREALLRLTQPAEAERALAETKSRWQQFAMRLQADVPDLAMQRYLTGWAAYQTLACRVLARTSLYQSGGAFGFRDQLQDAVNLLLLDAAPARAQILLSCAHQFTQGDVCHWWHSGAGAEHGVRTRISDDLLWLPWAVCEYVEKTGDDALCFARAPYLAAEPLADDERERYAALRAAAEEGAVLEHCVRAVTAVVERGVGAHGLLLIGTGDWNDGFDRVGAQGRGESVWLSWFFSHTAHRLAALLESHGDARGAALHEAAARVGAAAERAWDGAWYLRGWYDDGTPLGSAQSEACQIDAIAQSFAVLAPESTAEHRAQALQSALDRLFDRERNLVRLFDPPFERAVPDPGYLRSYGPGFRENGGQYTHGALWLAMALLREGRADDGWAILRAVLPAAHDPEVYEAEPYVLAADVCTRDGAERAGWTWYTGSAGWYLRVAAEELLGLRLRGGALEVRPRLPAAWKSCTVRLRDGAGETHTLVLTHDGVTADGRPYTDGALKIHI